MDKLKITYKQYVSFWRTACSGGYPGQRRGQAFCNTFGFHCPDLFYCPDDRFREAFDKWVEIA